MPEAVWVARRYTACTQPTKEHDHMQVQGIPKDEWRKALKLAATKVVEPRVTNEQFEAMTPAQKRVTIAKDVLKWIATRKLQPRKGTYLQVRTAETLPDDGDPDKSAWDCVGSLRPGVPNTKNLSETDTVNGDACYACALGGLFALNVERGGSAVRQAVTAADGFSQGIRDSLKGFFEPEQLTLIECAFERSASFQYRDGDEGLTYVDRAKAAKFGTAIHDQLYNPANGMFQWASGLSFEIDRRTMRAIMQNIIDNGGTFVP